MTIHYLTDGLPDGEMSILCNWKMKVKPDNHTEDCDMVECKNCLSILFDEMSYG